MKYTKRLFLFTCLASILNQNFDSLAQQAQEAITVESSDSTLGYQEGNPYQSPDVVVTTQVELTDETDELTPSIGDAYAATSDAGGSYFQSAYGISTPQVVELPEGFNANWYLENPAVPDALRSVLSQNENALNDYALRAHQNCTQLQDSGLLDFFNSEVMNLVRSKPKVCDAFEAKEETRQQVYWDMNAPVQYSYDSSSQKMVAINYTTYEFNADLLNQDELSPYEELLLAGLTKDTNAQQSPYILPYQSSITIPMPYSEQPALQDLPEENFTYMLTNPLEAMKRPPQLLVHTMLMRLWDKLSPLHQMQGLQSCPINLGLNDNTLTWELNNENQPDSSVHYNLFKKVCEADSIEDLLPFMDESIMTEFALYSGGLADTASVILPLCLSWPESQVVTPAPLPPVTRDQVLYRASELSRLSVNRYSRDAAAIGLLNRRDNSTLTPDQITALSDYTANGSYDRINAYEMWGRLGVWYIADDQMNGSLTQKQFNQYYPTPERSQFPTQESYESAFAHYLQLRAQVLPQLYGTPEQRVAAREQMQQNPQNTNSMTTLSGVHLSETSQHLRAALENLDGFEGVTFGGHQLSGHLFKGISIREGSTFSPGFFMSTSTTPGTALGFLGIGRGQGANQRTMERIQNGEDIDIKEAVTGYLFVVRNHNGVPISNYSNYSSENEILLHPDAEYNILKVEPLVFQGETYPNAQIVFLEEVLE